MPHVCLLKCRKRRLDIFFIGVLPSPDSRAIAVPAVQFIDESCMQAQIVALTIFV